MAKKQIIICDGCSVKNGFEHACHGENAIKRGVKTFKPCECPNCRETDRLFPDTAIIKPTKKQVKK